MSKWMRTTKIKPRQRWLTFVVTVGLAGCCGAMGCAPRQTARQVTNLSEPAASTAIAATVVDGIRTVRPVRSPTGADGGPP